MNKNNGNDKNKTETRHQSFLIILVILVMAAAPHITRGHGINTYEFNPDASRRSSNAEADSISFKFRPQDDIISAFDLWIDHSGSQSGIITFRLLNSSGQLLTEKGIAIDPTPAQEGGTRLHVDFSKQIALSLNQVYELEIISDINGLGIYYAASVELLQHNAEYNIDYVPGNAVVDGEEKSWTFKYAVYESEDALPPSLSNITAAPKTADTVELAFNANEPIDWQVHWGFAGQEYSQKIDFSGQHTSCLSGISKCKSLLQVQPNTAYDFKVVAKDRWDNISQAEGSFDSAKVDTAEEETTEETTEEESTVKDTSESPTISGTTIVGLTDKYIKIYWKTDIAADSRLLVSRDSEGNDVVTQTSDSILELEHVLQTTDVLESSTQYYARITSGTSGSAYLRNRTLAQIISSGNDDTSSWQVISFETAGSGDDTEETTSSETQDEEGASEITAQQNDDGTTTISWTDPSGGSGGGYRIDIFDENNNLVKQLGAPAGTNSTAVDGLPNGNYRVIAYENNDGVFEKIGPPVEIKGRQPILTNFQLFVISGLLLALFALWRAWQNIKKNRKEALTIKSREEPNVNTV